MTGADIGTTGAGGKGSTGVTTGTDATAATGTTATSTGADGATGDTPMGVGADTEPTMTMTVDTDGGDGMTEAGAMASGGSGVMDMSAQAGASMGGASTDDGTGDDMMGNDTTSVGDANTALGGSGNIGDCPGAPADAPPESVEALRIVTEARIAAGAGCITMVSELNAAAKNHCDYYAVNSGNCTADAHSEVEGCDGFTGSSPGARAQAAGYEGRSSFEVMAFANDPQQSIDMWINSVWHRLPVLSPWVAEMGYGAAEGCDTIDFGRGTPLADDVVVVYPYVDQVDVPTTFHGDREGPEPPMPPSGWPSGVPVNIYAQDVQISEHVLTVDGDDTPIEHMWLIPEEHDLLRDEVFLYSYTPLGAMTTYRVRLVGRYVGGDLNLDWTFTTGEAEPTRGGFGGN